MSNRTLASVVADYGQSAKGKLSSPAIQGEPEDQLRTPLHDLFTHDGGETWWSSWWVGRQEGVRCPQPGVPRAGRSVR
jgi:hypothetical protein